LNITDFFADPSVRGIGLAIIFGAIWLIAVSPLKLNRLSTWLVFAGGVIVFAPSIAWIQVPLQNLAGSLMIKWVGMNTYVQQLLFTSIPVILISGLVQEGAKLFPTAIYWQWHHKDISPVLGLTLGALAGAGFGILEALWINDIILASGWNFGMVQTYGFIALAGFWERFFTVCFHISIGAVAGWGLAKGWGWQFYLVASIAHALLNYSAVLAHAGILDDLGIEIFIAVCAVIVYGIVLWLRWRKTETPSGIDPGPEIKFY
jgi:hypothetical protein